MTFVCGVDWLKHAKQWLENGVNPELLYEMPTCRAYVLLFGSGEERGASIETAADVKKLRELILAKRKK